MATAKSLLFLCTGNYYRSRFAEILFNDLARKRSLDWQANSRALALERGFSNVGPISREALEMLATRGIHAPEACARFPAALCEADLEAAEHIVALKRAEHLPLFEERFPAWGDKVEFWHVDDIPGTLTIVESEVFRLLDRLS